MSIAVLVPILSMFQTLQIILTAQRRRGKGARTHGTNCPQYTEESEPTRKRNKA